jgi:hypothetical protein
MIVITNSIINTKNNILAIPIDVPATNPKPNSAAIKATTKNITAQLSNPPHSTMMYIELTRLYTYVVFFNTD